MWGHGLEDDSNWHGCYTTLYFSIFSTNYLGLQLIFVKTIQGGANLGKSNNSLPYRCVKRLAYIDKISYS
jgi:hypothetical protein